jgi:hypothetical protein
VAHLPEVEAWKVAGRKLLWWPGGSLLWRWGRSIVELLLLLLLRLLLLKLPWLEMWAIAPILLLLWSTQLAPRWGIHHVVLGRSYLQPRQLPADPDIIFFHFFSSTSPTTFIILS